MKEIKINTDFIKLDSFLKWCGAVQSGVEAKMFILDGKVKLNGQEETRRGKKIYKGDIIDFQGETYRVI
ncbi:S4 domain-containing protein YaaA [Clostridium oryzae]|uniref:Ribosome-associated protein n=1 Tax=Clostridium oryzae TaxID=1450648 RepID=A0A1V4I994_9CLOT|nr:S4 domain-containing protein YaaA [Clostridium oryzae]OPJ56097.1 ribosome-associated protein [Clostridium oryzae]